MTLRRGWQRYGHALLALAVLLGITTVSAQDGRRSGNDLFVGAGDEGGAFGEATTDGGVDGGVDDTDGASTTGGTGGSGATSSGAGAGGGGTGGTGGGGGGGGGGTVPCSPDGRTAEINYYGPPCVPVFAGDNGGATARGVTGGEIRVALYFQPENQSNEARATAGAGAGEADITAYHQALVDYFSHHYETYGRKVVLVPVRGAAATDEQAARANARKVAEEIKAFAVWAHSGTLPDAFVEEVTARGVLCMICGLLKTRQYFSERAGKLYSTLPPIEDMYDSLAEYIGKRLARRPARWAGDEFLPTQGFKQRERTFGILYTENIGGGVPDPEAKQAVDYFERKLAEHGVPLKAKFGYVSDLTRLPAIAVNAMLAMKDAGVTTVACMCGPFDPIYFTGEASRQQYYPEWLSAGCCAIDTTFFGRLFDQKQWRHFYGPSTTLLPAARIQDHTGYRMLHHMRENPSAGVVEAAKNGATRWPHLLFFIGVHMAGPNLTPDGFARGMYRYPRTGGTPALPLVYFTPQNPAFGGKDYSEVWWDADRTGPDEADINGVGLLMRIDGAQRYSYGRWPATEPKAFVREGAIHVEPDRYAHGSRHGEDGHRHDLTKACRSCR